MSGDAVVERVVRTPIGEKGASRAVFRYGMGIAAFAGMAAVWAAVAVIVTRVRGVPFPTPIDALVCLYHLLRGDLLLGNSIYRHLTDSLLRWGLGFAFAVGLGIPVGLLLGWSRTLDRLGTPSVHAVQLVPGLAWIPVAILLFGIGESATVFMIGVTAFAPIAINAAAGVKGADPLHLRAARMLGARNWSIFWRVLVPASVPHVVSGLRVGLANGWRVLVAGEMVVGTGSGLGYSILQSRWTLDYASAFACILIICAIGLFVERMVFKPLEEHTARKWGLLGGERG